MWRHFVRSCVAVLLLSLLPGLGAGSAVAGEDSKTVPAFERVSVSVAGTIRIHQSAEHKVVVSADESIRQRIQVEVNDGLLKVHCREHCSNLRHKGIDIYVSTLRELNLHNGGHMRVEQGFAATDQLNVNLHNGGHIDALALVAQKITAQLYNGGHINVSACSTLDAKIRNGGQIRYSGNPKVDGDVVNGGSIDKAKDENAGAACQAVLSKAVSS